ncbi:hypothetical protein SAMN05192574_103133 [Mucilaginibacter gossypiicola]|uniref:Uncharacterized protein n=1 Tax=Mucilaginibacter gossypiicola TaxID=551995 RepID=A0A1H8GGT8_9SPHI|nr:hypothetical protein [Mucilaginibacter gossypiicola]SEN43009.1 hypothetical protein SAMN05192574_103133 [Mucilaginibacter gossypiicola]
MECLQFTAFMHPVSLTQQKPAPNLPLQKACAVTFGYNDKYDAPTEP